MLFRFRREDIYPFYKTLSTYWPCHKLFPLRALSVVYLDAFGGLGFLSEQSSKNLYKALSSSKKFQHATLEKQGFFSQYATLSDLTYYQVRNSPRIKKTV